MDGTLETFDASLASGHPKINWSTAASFSQTAEDPPVDITTPATPGLHIQMPASPSALSPATGTLQVAQLTTPPSMRPEVCPARTEPRPTDAPALGAGLMTPPSSASAGRGSYDPALDATGGLPGSPGGSPWRGENSGLTW